MSNKAEARHRPDNSLYANRYNAEEPLVKYALHLQPQQTESLSWPKLAASVLLSPHKGIASKQR